MATVVSGAPRYEGGRTLTAASGVTITPGLVVKRGTTAGTGDICGVSDVPIGISLTGSLGGAAGQFDYAYEGAFSVTASEAIATETTGEPTNVFPAANGQVRNLPAANGTYYRVGWVDPESHASGAAGDVVQIVFDEAHVAFTVTGY